MQSRHAGNDSRGQLCVLHVTGRVQESIGACERF